jgi:hypothetical protein
VEFKFLELKLVELNEKFRNDLVNLLGSRGHTKTGILEASINFTFKRTGELNYNVHLDALEYLEYLEKGDLIESFMNEKTIELNAQIIEPIKKDFMIALKILKSDGTPDKRFKINK